MIPVLIPRQREDDSGDRGPWWHHVRVDRHQHENYSELRWRAYCTSCHSWWWREQGDGSGIDYTAVLSAAVQHATYGTWPTRERA